MNKLLFSILITALIVSNATCFGQSKVLNDKAFWNFIKNSFVNKEFTVAKFNEDVKIQLLGNYTDEDSVLVSNLAKELDRIIEDVNVYTTSENGNLKLIINTDTIRTRYFDVGIKTGGGWSGWLEYGSVHSSSTKLYFDSIVSQQNRNNVIRYKLVRNLVPFTLVNNGNIDEATGINQGGIFSLTDYKQTSITDFDSKILKTLYSDAFYKQFYKRYPIIYLKYASENSFSLINPLRKNPLRLLILALFVYGIAILRFWKFRKGNEKWLKYCFNAVVLIFPLFIVAVSGIIYNNHTYKIIFPVLIIMLTFFSIILVSIILGSILFLFEKYLLQNIKPNLIKYILQFLITASACYLAIFLLSETFQFYYYNSTLIYGLIVSFARVGFIFLEDRSQVKISEKELQLAKMEELKTKAELQLIQSRINPHFLYNSLNSIAALAIDNPEKTRKMAMSLSDFCRYAINKTNVDFAIVDDEVNVANSYLEIEKVRFGDRLKFSIHVEKDIKGIKIPRFIIQPLIENAVKHGASKITDVCEIELNIQSLNGGVLIAVSDNGPSFPEVPVYGYGLQYIFDKLEMIYEGHAKINWKNHPDKMITVWLPVKSKTTDEL